MPVKARIQIRRDIAANWAAAPNILGRGILYEGEFGLNLDTGQVKIGDGVTHWNGLSYTVGGGGTPGPIGPQGVQGVQGSQGLQGSQGFQGLQGPQGTQGVQGTQGNQGLQGNQGTQGLQGSQGVQGIQGVQGTQGNQGVQGNQGTQGVQGQQGTQGLQGIAGSGVAIGGSANQVIYKDATGIATGNVDFTFGVVGGSEPTMSVPTIEMPSTTVASATNKLYNLASKLQWSGGMDLGGAFSAVSKSFDIPHPSKKNARLVYGSLESPYHGVRLTGRAKTKNGKCVVRLPKYIKDLVKEEDCAVYLSNYGHGKVLYTEQIDISKNRITIKVAEPVKGEELEFFWDFTAIRKDIPDLVVEP